MVEDCTSPTPPHRFDQRPGVFEATRPDPQLIVVGSRQGDAGFLVLALARHEQGLAQILLTPEQADAIAAQLATMASVCRGEHAALVKRQAEQEACR